MRKLPFILALALLLGLLIGRLLGPESGTGHLVESAEGETLAPRFALAHGEGLFLSWLEATPSSAMLHFARLGAEGLGERQTAARGGGWFVNFADRPALHLAAPGLWIAHWLERSGDAPYAYGIRLAFSRDAGQRWSPAGIPHPDLPSEFGFVSHLRWPDGRAGLVWLDGRDLNPASGVGAMALRHAFLDPDGRVRDERRLDPKVCECCATDALSTPEGPVVVYRGRDAEEIRDVRLVHALGGAWSAPRTVHTDRWQMPACPVNGPRIASAGASLAVAWFTAAKERPRILLAFAPAPDAPYSPPLEVAAGADLIGRVALAGAPDGRLWLLYLREAEADLQVELVAFRASGSLEARRTVGRAAGGRRGGFPELAYDPALGLWAAWTVEREGRRMVELRRLGPP